MHCSYFLGSCTLLLITGVIIFAETRELIFTYFEPKNSIVLYGQKSIFAAHMEILAAFCGKK